MSANWNDYPPKEFCTPMENGYTVFCDMNSIEYESTVGFIDRVVITKNIDKARHFEKSGYKMIFTPNQHGINQYVLVREKSSKEVLKYIKSLKKWVQRHKNSPLS